jgi:hypothetical protein
MVVPSFIIDIGCSHRTYSQAAAYNQLIVGDQTVEIEFTEDGSPWNIPVAADFNATLVAREVGTGVLVTSTGWLLSGVNKITLDIDTTDADVLAYLGTARGKEVVIEVSRTDAGNEQTLARWILMVWASGDLTP